MYQVKTLKLAVCYARDTSISMPETSVILGYCKTIEFRNLHLHMYAINKIFFLSMVNSKTSVTSKDFNGAVTYMHSLFFNKF